MIYYESEENIMTWDELNEKYPEEIYLNDMIANGYEPD